MNGLVDKKEMDDGCRAVRATITPIAESRSHRILALNVLETTLDDVARNGRKTSRGEKLLSGLERNLERNLEQKLGRMLELEQLYATCANSLQDWSKWKSS